MGIAGFLDKLLLFKNLQNFALEIFGGRIQIHDFTSLFISNFFELLKR